MKDVIEQNKQASDPTVGMSDFGAELFNCFKSPVQAEQIRALNNLRVPCNPATLEQKAAIEKEAVVSEILKHIGAVEL